MLIGLALWLRRIQKALRGEAGASLVEVLVATAVLVLVLVPMLDFSAYIYSGQAYERQLAATLAASKLEDLQKETYRKPFGALWSPAAEDSISLGMGRYEFSRKPTLDLIPGGAIPVGTEAAYVRKVTVRVTCEKGCKKHVSVEVVGYIARVAGSTTTY